MSRILVICGHPNLEASVANKAVLNTLQEHYGNRIKIRPLDQLRTDGTFNIAAEQQALREADTVIFQFPVYWYATPAILKQWMDEVLLYGFAYGHTGDALRGKRLLVSVTAGGQEQPYKEVLPHDLPTFFAPFEDTAAFTGMKWLDPVYSYGALPAGGEQENNHESIVQLGRDQARKIIARLES